MVLISCQVKCDVSLLLPFICCSILTGFAMFSEWRPHDGSYQRLKDLMFQNQVGIRTGRKV